MSSHNGADSIASLVGIIKWNGANVMVQDVGLDNAVKQVASNESELAINSSGGTTNEIPLLLGVVGKRRIGVLEESDSNEPVVHPHVWKEVPHKHVGGAIGLGEVDESSHGDTDTDIREDDGEGVTVLVERAARIKVVDATAESVLLALSTALTMLLVVVMAGNVGEEVVPPTNGLLTDQVDQSKDRGLLSQLGKLVNHLAETAGLLLAGAGQENHVALHVSGSLVVLRVGELPAEVRD